MSIEYGTSFPENAVAFYLGQFFDLEQNVRFSWLKRSELDIFIEELNIAIEYDGEYFHRNKSQKDNEKDLLCHERGIELIRIREVGLPDLDGSVCFWVDPKKSDSLDQAIENVVNYVCNKGCVSSSKVDIDTTRDDIAIQNYFIITSKKRSFLEKCPKESKEWNYSKNGNLLPEKYAYTSKFRVWWICSKGHEWRAPIYSRANGNGCPYCANRKVLVGFNDLASKDRKIASEWDYEKNYPKIPEQVVYGSNAVYWWKCSEGHEWRAAVYSRIIDGDGCPYCAGLLAIPGVNDLLTLNEPLAKEWDYEKNAPLTPSDVMLYTNKKVWWIGKCGHSWQAQPYSRNGGSRGCPYCTHEKVLPGVNDLLTLNPELAKEWDYEKNYPLRPEDVMPNSNKKYWWICPEGHSYSSVLNSRNGQGTGCAYCGHKKVLPGFNDLATTHPELVAEWDYDKNGDLDPHKIINSRDKIWSRTLL